MGKLLIELKNDDEQLFYHLITHSKICVVDFYADWCGPCIKLGKMLEEKLPANNNIIHHIVKPNEDLSKENIKDKIVMIKINVDNFEDLAKPYKISSIPHVIFYKKGQLQSDIHSSFDGIVKMIESLLI
jgi:thioredoxin 1